MQFRYLIILGVLFIGLSAFNVPKKKEIKVQIKHDSKVILDTTLYEEEENAKEAIENLVKQFSDEDPMLSSEKVFGLYVFNIDNENWKERPDSKATAQRNNAKTTRPNHNSEDIDDMFDELSDELDNQWEKVTIEMVLDTIGGTLKVLKKEVQESDIYNDPTVDQFRQDLKGLYNKLRSTKVIIIHEGDTVKGP